MKARLLPALLAACLLAACGDSQEKLMEDQLDYLDEITAIVEEVADGSLSSSEAAAEIREWAEKGEALQRRKAALRKELTADELQALTRQYSQRSMEAVRDMMAAMGRLEQSGRMTAELGEALSSVNP
jgi:hypothetical protein